jgi:hypothetical protein
MILQNCSSSDTRERIHEQTWFLPEFFVTWLIAKPRTGQSTCRKTAGEELISTFLLFGAGLISLIIGNSAFGDSLLLWAIPVSQLCLLSSLRMQRLTLMHACSHNAVFPNPRWNQVLGEFISILTLSVPFKAYKKKHCETHHSKQLMQPGDETYEFFYKAGFHQGMTSEQAWQHLIKIIFSPTFHCRQFLNRLKSTFCSTDATHNSLAFGFWLSVLGLVTITDTWAVFLLVFVPTLSVFFEISSVLRQCVEHKFAKTPGEMTSAIFCCEEPPIFNKFDSIWVKFWGELRWWLRLFFYHLPVRLLILTGDSPVHDYHHRRPASDWVNAHSDRQAEVEAGISYSHSWGLLEAINKTFESFSKMPTS